MYEITIISGKGGTGKTILTAAFAHLASKHIICDLDVDASDLHILLERKRDFKKDFFSGNEAIISPTKCIDCEACISLCKFEAIHKSKKGPSIDPIRCEGCGVCVRHCPQNAISFPKKHCGEWYQSQTSFAPMIHAQLFPGEENSGLLVSLLRKEAKKLAIEKGSNLLICDGSPGIGCPVISSLTGTNLAIVVTEPTLSGMHDLKRVLALCNHFSIPVKVVINKYDLNKNQTACIEEYCSVSNIEIISQIPYSQAIIDSVMMKKTIIEYGDGIVSNIIKETWNKIKKEITNA
jgi:MinD superfamily P-loop ATPase